MNRGTLRLTALLAALAVVGASGWALLRDRGEPPPRPAASVDVAAGETPPPRTREPTSPATRPPDEHSVAATPKPAWLSNAVASIDTAGRPMIAVVIDDVGVDRRRSARAMALPAPMTIALLAYSEDAREQASAARRAGHELLVHLPMQPGDVGEDPGPNALRGDLRQDEFTRRLQWNLSRFSGYVGVNNHMGSNLTRNETALAPVMAELKQRGLLFLDSRTTAATRAAAVARRYGVPTVERDVFLDHDPSPIGVRTALVRVEDIARKNGFAVAIGHPKDATLDALEEWLPDVRQRGFAIVPLTAVVRRVVAGAG